VRDGNGHVTLGIGGGVVAVVLIVLLINTLRTKSRQIRVDPAPAIVFDEMAAAQRLAEAVRFKTVAPAQPDQLDAKPLLALHEFLRASFPGVHRALRREVVNDHSLLYTWPGNAATRKPILLMAHLDVVPVESAAEREWIEPPFSGRIADGYIWGRGSIDDKSAVLGILEAVEYLVQANARPARTVYLAFGHDEESRGHDGAERIAAVLKARGIAVEYVLDEGMVIGERLVPGVRAPVALVGTAEKGWLTIELSAGGAGGHASMPPAHTAIGLLATALHRIEAHPLPAALKPPVTDLFAAVTREMPFLQRMLFANLWMFSPLIVRRLAAAPASNAIVRTTTAVTVVQGGTRDNVLPKAATALVNFRILPGETAAKVMQSIRGIVNDPRIELRLIKQEEPSAVSTTASASYRMIATTIRQVFPGVLVAPALAVVRTDSSHFLDISDAVYRFRPLRFTAEDLTRIHGVNERLAVDAYAGLVRFYIELLRNSAL